MSEKKTYMELFKKELANRRKKNLRCITYIIGDDAREGYVEIDDLEQRFIPIRDSELCDDVIRYINSDCIQEYTLRPLMKKEQENWEGTVDYEAEFGAGE